MAAHTSLADLIRDNDPGFAATIYDLPLSQAAKLISQRYNTTLPEPGHVSEWVKQTQQIVEAHFRLPPEIRHALQIQRSILSIVEH